MYIIGGIIDRNSHKGLSFERATAKGIATARLPIDEYMRMTACRVLATNHGTSVFQPCTPHLRQMASLHWPWAP